MEEDLVQEDQTPEKDTAESKAPRRVATFADLQSKRVREGDVPIHTTDADGNEITLVLKYRAINGKAYDALQAEHPPQPKQEKRGAIYNPDTFGPALVSAVCVEPKMTPEQVSELFADEKWSGGESESLFVAALRICNAGLDVPFTVDG